MFNSIAPRPSRVLLSTLLAVFSASFALSALHSHAEAAPPSRVTIDGSSLEVRWSDGDSLRFVSGRLRGERARLMGYNTLEPYGPVHKWGEWNEWDLYRIAKNAKNLAGREAWECTLAERKDHYGRYLMRCPKLTEAMVREGIAHIFEVTGDPSEALIKLQREAIDGRRGMWKGGAPAGLITSLHSADEARAKKDPSYNRIANLKTGRANKHFHQERYELCQWVCLEGSCMRYVPFNQRYGDKRPPCLKWSGAKGK